MSKKYVPNLTGLMAVLLPAQLPASEQAVRQLLDQRSCRQCDLRQADLWIEDLSGVDPKGNPLEGAMGLHQSSVN
ncbi:MAG: hypothetical protein ABW155_13835 [Candidatus Thiodiazotropha sp.]